MKKVILLLTWLLVGLLSACGPSQKAIRALEDENWGMRRDAA